MNGKSFSASLLELKREYRRLKKLSDDDFIKEIKKALHLSCIVSFIKKLDINDTIGDYGLIHQLIHLLDIPEEPLVDIREIRNQFETLLRLDEALTTKMSSKMVESFKQLISGGVCYYDKDGSYRKLYDMGLCCKNESFYYLDNTVKNPQKVLQIAESLENQNILMDLETYCQIKRLKIYAK